MTRRMLVTLTAIAGGLEYYDFIVYGLLSTYLSLNFFPLDNKLLALIHTLMIFALGYFARPIGGLIFGQMGDKQGRKKGFLISMTCIAISTVCIGLLPTYATLGTTSTLLLIILRVIQGGAFGAELPGISTFMSEQTQLKRRGLSFGVVLAGINLGGMAGILFIFALSQMLSHSQMVAFGWRLPFLLGGVLAFLNLILRRQLNESPVFEKFLQQRDSGIVHQPLKLLWKRHRQQLLLGFFVTLFGACFVIFGITMPSYLHLNYDYSFRLIYKAITIGFIFSMLTLPFFGWVADRLGRVRLLLLSAAIMVVGSTLLFKLPHYHSLYGLITFVLCFHLIMSALANSYMPLLSRLFPIEVRFTGVALCYNLAFLVASLTPLALHYLTILLPALAATTVIAAIYLLLNKKNLYAIEESESST